MEITIVKALAITMLLGIWFLLVTMVDKKVSDQVNLIFFKSFIFIIAIALAFFLGGLFMNQY